MGFAGDHQFDFRWLKEARRILKPDGTIWVMGTHHIIFSIGFALQSLGLKLITRSLGRSPIRLRTPSTAFTQTKLVETNTRRLAY